MHRVHIRSPNKQNIIETIKGSRDPDYKQRGKVVPSEAIRNH